MMASAMGRRLWVRRMTKIYSFATEGIGFFTVSRSPAARTHCL